MSRSSLLVRLWSSANDKTPRAKKKFAISDRIVNNSVIDYPLAYLYLILLLSLLFFLSIKLFSQDKIYLSKILSHFECFNF
ncbi:hypothetical protein DXX96_03935 [Lactococcus petauri]|nr:hypothetical protein [Lactococcus petauri]